MVTGTDTSRMTGLSNLIIETSCMGVQISKALYYAVSQTDVCKTDSMGIIPIKYLLKMLMKRVLLVGI